MAKYQCNLVADYFQIHLQDELCQTGLEDAWTEEATDEMLAVEDGIIGVGTARNTDVPVMLCIEDRQPSISFDEWDHVMECSLRIESGQLVILGCTEEFDKAARVAVAPGWYRVRVFYGGLDTVSEDGLQGDDHYAVILWPSSRRETQILK